MGSPLPSLGRLGSFGVGLGLLAVVSACETGRRADLRHNDALYVNTGYQARLPVDRAAFVAPLRDSRSAAVPASAGDSNYHALAENAWERPMRLMIEDILRDEVRESGVVTEVFQRALPDALVLQPYLLACTCGSTEEVSGGRALAEVELRLQVYGPVDETGGRPLLRDEVYGDRQSSGVVLRPPPQVLLLGRALRTTMAKMLQDVDTSNVSRAGVPHLEAEPAGAPTKPKEIDWSKPGAGTGGGASPK